MKTATLKKNFVYNFISQILTLIIPFVTTPYLARVLTAEGNGQFSYANSIITYFLLFANLGFNIYGQREIARKRNDKEAKSKVFWEIFIVKGITSCFSFIVLFILILSVGFGEKYNFLMIILSIQVFAVIFDIQYLLQGEEDFKGIALRTIVLKLLGMIGIFVLVKSINDIWIYALCISVSTILSNLIVWPSIRKRLQKVKIKELKLRRNILPAILIFLPTMAVTVYSVFDKTMIGLLAQNPDYANGCYEQAYKINSVALLLIVVISPILIPRNSYDYQVGNTDALKGHLYFACNYVWFFSLPLIAGFLVLSNNISSWFLGDGYMDVPLLLKIMSIRFVFSGFGVIFGDQLYIAIGKEKYPTIATIAAGLINITANFFLIPVLGALGAAITTAISEILVTVILAIFVFRDKFLSLKKILLMSWKYFIAAVIMLISIYYMQNNLSYSIWEFLLISGVGFIIYILVLLILRDKFLLNIIHKFFSHLKELKNRIKKDVKEPPAM